KYIYETLLDSAPDAIQLIAYDSVKQMEKEMDERNLYGGLVIPTDFSQEIASLQGENPTYANLNIYINEGHHPSVASTLETILISITDNIGKNMANEMLNKMDEVSEEMEKTITGQLQNLQSVIDMDAMNPETVEQLGEITSLISPVQPDQVQLLASPINAEVIKVNEVGELATVPSALFITVWVSSLLGAMLFYLAGNKLAFTNIKSKYTFQVTQSILPIVYSLFTGYLITLFSTWVLDYEFASFHSVALTLSIALVGFVYLILATLTWLKTPAIALFGILMFFGLPLIQMAPEMIPEFYQSYVLPWLPMRFLIESLKEVLFFNQSVLNHYANVLLGMSGVSLIIIWLKNLTIKTIEK